VELPGLGSAPAHAVGAGGEAGGAILGNRLLFPVRRPGAAKLSASGSGPGLAIQAVAASVSGPGVSRDLVGGGCDIAAIRAAGLTRWPQVASSHPGRIDVGAVDAGPIRVEHR